jgi:hypothetical protein
MKRTLILAVLIVFVGNIFAQQKKASISWDKTVNDFKAFKEEAGPQTATFTYTNTGNEPLVITNVKASCGCTTPNWTKEPVGPGENGFVKATYDPKNRPGKFNKSITVTTNADQPTTILRITGEVTPREMTIEDYYPKAFGDIRLKTSHLAFIKVYNTEIKTDSIPVVNMGEADATITFKNVPDHLSFKVEPATLKGMKKGETNGQKGVILVTYNGKKKNDWGFNMDRVEIVVNGEPNPKDRLSVSATIEEDFTHLTPEEKANAPHVAFDNAEFEFGTLKQGESISTDFVFKNTGKSDLVIRKVKASCGCTATSPEKMVIKPGETSKIATTFNSRGKRGRQNKTITVITNDPDSPNTILKIKGVVEE